MRVALVTQVIEDWLAHNATTLIVTPIGSSFPIEDFLAKSVFRRCW